MAPYIPKSVAPLSVMELGKGYALKIMALVDFPNPLVAMRLTEYSVPVLAGVPVTVPVMAPVLASIFNSLGNPDSVQVGA